MNSRYSAKSETSRLQSLDCPCTSNAASAASLLLKFAAPVVRKVPFADCPNVEGVSAARLTAAMRCTRRFNLADELLALCHAVKRHLGVMQ